MTRREVIELILKMKGGQATRRNVKGVRSSFSDLRGTITGLKATLAGIGVGVVVKQLFEAGVEAQRFNRQMKLATGSSAEAAKEIAWLRQTAHDLGQEFYTIRPAYAEFLETTKNTSLAGQRSREIFQGLLEGATALNKGTADTEGILRALVQMISKGNVQAEELRGQLGERLPGAFNLAAQAMGVTTKELNKMLEQGEVAAGDLLPRLARALHEKYGKAAKEASNDAQQGLNRFITAWKDLKTEMADTGFLDEATKALSAFTAILKDQKTHAMARALSKLVSDLVETFITKPLTVAINADDLARLRKIESLQRQIAGTQAKINQTEKDMHSWRAKIAGKDVYEKQLQRYKDRLKALNDQLQAQQSAVSDPERPAATEAPSSSSKPFSKLPPAPGDAKKTLGQADLIEARVARLNALAETQVAKLESLWGRGLVSMQDYFSQRQELIEEQYQTEITALKKLAAAEEDPSKKLELETEIFEKQQEYKQALIKLTEQQIEAEEALADKKQQIADMLDDINERANEDGIDSLESRFEAEIEAMEERHEAEIEALEELNATKEEIEEARRAHEREAEKKQLGYEKKLAQARISLAAKTAGYIADTFYALYVATGEQNKWMLDLYKTAAIAEVVISTAAAIMNAYKDNNFYVATGMAIYLGALGAAQIATINAQQLAYGGPVLGYSSSDRADNVPIMATADEYMIQRPSARYYGRRVMDAINSAMIPRGMLENALAGASVPSFQPAYALATGGPVPDVPGGGSTVVGDIELTVMARDAQSFADDPETTADAVNEALRLGLLKLKGY